MKVYKDISLSDFEFWSGAISRAEEYTSGELDQIGKYLEYNYPDGMSETEINDLFWFDEEFVASILGYKYNTEAGKLVRPDDDDFDELEDF